jgi:hypothetical protein
VSKTLGGNSILQFFLKSFPFFLFSKKRLIERLRLVVIFHSNIFSAVKKQAAKAEPLVSMAPRVNVNGELEWCRVLWLDSEVIPQFAYLIHFFPPIWIATFST